MSQLPPKFENLGEKLCLVTAVMPVSGGLGGLYPTRNLGVQFSYSNQEGGGGKIMPTTIAPLGLKT